MGMLLSFLFLSQIQGNQLSPPVQSFAMTEENQQIKSPQEPPADQAVPPLPSKYKENNFLMFCCL
jgi:hypothetical protein